MNRLIALKHTCESRQCNHPQRYKLPPDQKLQKSDVRKIISDPRAGKLRWIIYRLMDGPITLRTAQEFLDIETREHSSLAYRINQAFRNRLGIDTNAIIIEGLDGMASPKSFWVMRLNPELFALPPDHGKLIPGKHIKLADLLTPIQRLIISYLAENPYRTIEQLKQRFSKEIGCVKDQAGDGTINLRCKRKGFPPALLRTKTEPRAYYLNPEFAALFGIKTAPCKGTLEELFKPEAQTIITCIAEHTEASLDDIRKALDADPSFKLKGRVKIIRKRCEELGLPQPFERVGGGIKTRYKLTEEFRTRFKLQNSKESIEQYFTKALIPLVKMISEEPWISGKEMAEKLGITRFVLHARIKRVIKTCTQKGLPKLHVKHVGSNNENIYRWSKPFLKRFGLREGKVEFARLLRGNQRRVYEYWQGKEVVYTRQACRDLVIKREPLYTALTSVNRKLKEHGLPELKQPWWNKARVGQNEVKDELVIYRIKHGKWPELEELKKKNPNLALGIHDHLGGIRKVMRHVRATLCNEEIAAILVADLHRQEKRTNRNGNGRTKGNGAANGHGDRISELVGKIERALENGTGKDELVARLDKAEPRAIIRFIDFGASRAQAEVMSASFYAQHRAPGNWPFG
ncbi:hypothetical protein J4450_04975 [Candidatus Micrarchaeota archaeon]|nr:hypothetical protein [Candidatus Micrarchaeota archaeon]